MARIPTQSHSAIAKRLPENVLIEEIIRRTESGAIVISILGASAKSDIVMFHSKGNCTGHFVECIDDGNEEKPLTEEQN